MKEAGLRWIIPGVDRMVRISPREIVMRRSLPGRDHPRQRLDQAKRFKELEKENARLKKLVAEQALDNAILKKAASGNF